LTRARTSALRAIVARVGLSSQGSACSARASSSPLISSTLAQSAWRSVRVMGARLRQSSSRVHAVREAGLALASRRAASTSSLVQTQGLPAVAAMRPARSLIEPLPASQEPLYEGVRGGEKSGRTRWRSKSSRC